MCGRFTQTEKEAEALTKRFGAILSERTPSRQTARTLTPLTPRTGERGRSRPSVVVPLPLVPPALDPCGYLLIPKPTLLL